MSRILPSALRALKHERTGILRVHTSSVARCRQSRRAYSGSAGTGRRTVPLGARRMGDLEEVSFLRKIFVAPVLMLGLYITLRILYALDGFYFGITRAVYRSYVVLHEATLISLYYNFYKWTSRTEVDALTALSRCHETASHHVLGKMLDLGGVYVKMGQLMSSMTQVLPLEWCIVMESCLDNATPMQPAYTVGVITGGHEAGGLGQYTAELFDDFEYFPVKAASIAQVHLAKERDTGNRLAVKIQYNDLPTMMAIDFRILNGLAWFLDWETPGVYGLMKHFQSTIMSELDFLSEAANCMRFREMFKDWEQVDSPTVHTKLCSSKVITMDFIDGFNINEAAKLDVLGIPRQEVADLIVNVIASSIFDHGFLHADPHPANIFVEPLNNTHIIGCDAERERRGGMIDYKGEVVREHGMSSKSLMGEEGVPESMQDLFDKMLEGFDKREKKEESKTEGLQLRCPYAIPELTDGETKWKMQILDHGCYQELSDDFCGNYADLWCGVAGSDRRKIETACENLGVRNPKLLTTILLGEAGVKLSGTSRLSEEMSRGDFHIPHTSSTNMALGMLEVMGEVPKEMVLVLKCNSLLRSIQSDLSVRPTYQSIMMEHAVRFNENKKLAAASSASETRAAKAEAEELLRRLKL